MKKIITFFKLLLFVRKWKKKNGNNSTYPGNLFDASRVLIGDYTYGQLNVKMYGNSNSQLIVGKLCSIADNTVFILDGEHHINLLTTYPIKQRFIGKVREAFSRGDIMIDDDVWIGYGCTILSGVHIGQGAVIAAGAVVSQDVPPYAVVGGVPAKVIKYRFSEEIVTELLKVDYKKLTKKMIELHMGEIYTDLTDVKQLDWLPKLEQDVK